MAIDTGSTTIRRRVILSLGGSLMVPDHIDTQFISRVIRLIREMSTTHAFVVFCGGGKTARKYQEALQACAEVSDEARDWVGIESSILNATLLKHAFAGDADEYIITDPRVQLSWEKSVYIGAGWKPGRSTDYDAVRLAVENDVTLVINLSNVEYVYSADPRTHPDAQRFERMSWAELRSIVGDQWSPGMNVPFDPIAAQLAEEHDITVRFLHGKHLDELPQVISGELFHGTDISNGLTR